MLCFVYVLYTDIRAFLLSSCSSCFNWYHSRTNGRTASHTKMRFYKVLDISWGYHLRTYIYESKILLLLFSIGRWVIESRALTVIFIGTLQYKWFLWTGTIPLPVSRVIWMKPHFTSELRLWPIVSCPCSGIIGDGTIDHQDRNWQNSANNLCSSQ